MKTFYIQRGIKGPIYVWNTLCASSIHFLILCVGSSFWDLSSCPAHSLIYRFLNHILLSGQELSRHHTHTSKLNGLKLKCKNLWRQTVLMWRGWAGLILLLWFCDGSCLIPSILLQGRRRLGESSVLRGVVRAAAAALHAQHMERHRAVSLAVVTDNLQWGRTKGMVGFTCNPDHSTVLCEVLLWLWHPGIQWASVTGRSLCLSGPSGPPCSRQNAYTEGSDMLYNRQGNSFCVSPCI